jgi:uncharacterized membrane protein YccC
MIAGVFSSLFANMDDPTPAIRQMFYYILASVPIAALYQFFILPAVDGLPLLMLVLAPFLLTVGILLATPVHSSRAMPLIIGVIPAISLTSRYNADFVGFMNSSVAQLVGVLVALTSVALVSAIGADASVRRIRRAGWRDLGSLARARRLPSRSAWASRMLDRVGLLLTRDAIIAESGEQPRDSDALGDLRVGASIIELRHVAQEMPASSPVHALLAKLAEHFRARSTGRAGPTLAELAEDIDQSLNAVASLRDVPPRWTGLLALTSLRRNLAPQLSAPDMPAPQLGHDR